MYFEIVLLQNLTAMTVRLSARWQEIIGEEFEKEYFQSLKQFLQQEIIKKKIIYPHPKNFFAAFDATEFDDIRVVLLGQDPYHGEHQAHGMCFSVPKDQKKIPPSLKNIFKEIGISPSHGNLEHLAKQGVFLLNATLSVEAHHAGSHQHKGWEVFTDAVIRNISEKKQGVIFLLWGNFAISKQCLIDSKKHTILTAPHPSPLSAHRGFLGCGHFITTNQILRQQGEKEIEWEDLHH